MPEQTPVDLAWEAYKADQIASGTRRRALRRRDFLAGWEAHLIATRPSVGPVDNSSWREREQILAGPPNCTVYVPGGSARRRRGWYFGISRSGLARVSFGSLSYASYHPSFVTLDVPGSAGV
jgi:hypothetical protein